MMSSGAMTCVIRLQIRHPVQRSQSRESANLNLSDDGQEDIRCAASGTPQRNQQQ